MRILVADKLAQWGYEVTRGIGQTGLVAQLRVGSGNQPNVFYNTGHGHLGWTLSAITAHQLGEHVTRWEKMRAPMLVPVTATV